ncbi:hypothetical protein [Paraburkholderia sp. BL10I2N1]|uniref:hypothetical protein n=1 Tax=Paraburkholderia sp. BL10I2N1 TaxID=1938796 RepID=UPI001061D8B0|nr:hypothetical protein [Paraburkholderia sp. BL10I2N1]
MAEADFRQMMDEALTRPGGPGAVQPGLSAPYVRKRPQLVTDVPATVPRALLPEFIAALIRQRSPRIRIRNLRASARCAGRMSLIDPF